MPGKKTYDLGATLTKISKTDEGDGNLTPEVAFSNGKGSHTSTNGKGSHINNGKDTDNQTKTILTDADPKNNGMVRKSSDGDASDKSTGSGKKEPIERVGTFELFKFATKFDRFLIFLGTIGSVVAGVCYIGNITIVGEVINLFVDDGSNSTGFNSTTDEPKKYLDDLMPYIFAYIIVGSISLVSGFTAICCWTLSSDRQVSTMRKRFFLSVMSRDIGWFDVHGSGEISSRFSEDLVKVQEGLGDKAGIFIQWTCTWLAALVMSFTRSWKLTLFALPFSPLTILVGLLLFRTMRRMAARESKAYSKAGAIAEQAFRAIRTVQAFQGQEKESARYDSHLGAAVKTAYKKGLVLGLANSSVWMIVYVMFAASMWFGLWLIQNEDMKTGAVIQVFMGILIGSMSLGQAFSNLESLSNARGAAVKVFQIIAQDSAIDAFSKEGRRPDRLEGTIEFKQVAFNYPARPDVMVAQDLSFTVHPGQHVALVGPSGCGKSTSIQLLQRFYDPKAGQVLVDGHDVRDLNVQWLRSHIGVVSQEPVLFDASIEENIRLGKVDATLEEIQAAAKMSNAHDFIELLPEGYKTNVGERGAQLSGGQKQRISIARALVRNPRILLMDEATSALDHESEALVQAALEKAGKGRTTITIAHRLSTVRHADKILTIHGGQVVEGGTHDQLMAREGLYYQLVQIQTKISEDSQLDISDVVIVDEDLDESSADDQLLGADLRRTLSSGGKSDSTHLAVRHSHRASRRSNKSSAKPQDTVSGTEAEKVEEPCEEARLLEILRYNAPEWPYVLVGCLASVVAGTVQPCFTFILSEFIKIMSTMDNSKQREQVNLIGGIILGLAVLLGFTRVLQDFCISRAGAYLTRRLRKLTFESIINQDMEYFDSPNNQVGAITAKLAGDAALVQGATGSKIGQFLEGLTTISCALVIALVYGWKLALVVLSFMPVMISAGIVQGKAMAGAAHQEKSQLQLAGRMCSEAVDNIRTVASLGREDFFVTAFNKLIDQNKASNRKKSVVYGIAYSVANSALFFAYAGAFYYGGILIDDGEMEFHDVFRVFGAIVFGGIVAGRQLSFGVDYVKAKMAAGRIISLINRKPKIDVRDSTGDKLETMTGSLTLEGVSFHYASRPNVKVLDGYNLVIQPGQTVALVGASGCGKSTAAQLAQRFYDVDGGALKADGRDVRELNLRWYRQQIGVVAQEPSLFDCSIADNIAYGDNSREVPRAEIIAAARDANIHNFITSLPQGYDTDVGEKGTQLSGGQKQRVAIARALVRNPKILLLDEATSALDTESERVVQEALDRASENRTCITIAHRLSTVQKADKIAVVSKGKVVESGTHRELMTIKGAYYRLQMAQDKTST